MLSDPKYAQLVASATWDDAMLEELEIEVQERLLVTVGGGLGSFALVDFLRIAGVEPAQIAVLTSLEVPWQTFAARADASQLGPQERLRSDSSSTIHNIWGWPGYAVSEAWTERTLRPLWKVITEPFLAEYFTPRVCNVIASLERETERIGWQAMVAPCWVELVRRRSGGGYFALARALDGGRLTAYRCRHLHLALGYPGPRVLSDAQAFRDANPGCQRVANAYEEHEHVYQAARTCAGRIVIRGSGIAASRILERLIQEREDSGATFEILHVFRHFVRAAVGPPWFRRPGRDGFAYQPFNFPRGAGGGQLRQRMLRMSSKERAELLPRIGGTTTAWRRRWQRQLERGRREKWYRAVEGELGEISAAPDGRLALLLEERGSAPERVDADFLLDATGLEDSVMRCPLLADLVTTSGATLNALGRLDVAPSFEVRALRNGPGRMYASGAATLGGALAPVDSFWGLTHAAMEITDDLADQQSCEFPGVMRSLTQWWRWARRLPP
ncbi:MAG: hypothetical protein IPI49_22820 [Myxococcales bacterium]|nr:hypothetical protein [Myxococcales bacterium]